jgi:hypothetical protein
MLSMPGRLHGVFDSANMNDLAICIRAANCMSTSEEGVIDSVPFLLAMRSNSSSVNISSCT